MKFLEWLTENWFAISIAIFALTSILNSITKHFSESKGLVKVCLFITEMLSILSSAGVELSKIKLPLQSVKPIKEEE